MKEEHDSKETDEDRARETKSERSEQSWQGKTAEKKKANVSFAGIDHAGLLARSSTRVLICCLLQLPRSMLTCGINKVDTRKCCKEAWTGKSSAPTCMLRSWTRQEYEKGNKLQCTGKHEGHGTGKSS